MTDTNTTIDAATLAQFAQLASAQQMAKDLITGEEVSFTEGPQILIPHGMTYTKANRILKRMQEEAETEQRYQRTFEYRWKDGAVAASRVMKRMFGMTIGVGQQSFFGSTPPQTANIKISATESIEVPVEDISIPALDNTTIYVGHAAGLAYVAFTGPKKYSKIARDLLDGIEHELRTNSIYRGKAIIGSTDPEFLDLSGFNPAEIVFSTDVMNTLEGSLWSAIRHRDAFKAEGVRLKRAILLEGPYGTGKSSAGMLTALEAVNNGWTFIAARAGKDDVKEVLKTAKIYAPAVVFIEDIDTQTAAGKGDDDAVSRLLESFDGITSKGQDVALLMTTNHFERIHKGMLRPGRIDAVVEVAELDRVGVEKLARAVVANDRLADDLDFDKVYEAMSITVDGERVGFLPAYVREALERARAFAIGRLNGDTRYVLSTTDLVGAASSLHAQLKAQHQAKEGSAKVTFEDKFRDIVEGGLNKVEVVDRYGDKEGELRVGSSK